MSPDSIYELSQYLIGFFGLVFNTFLLYCVIRHTPNNMKEMGRLLTNLAIVDLLQGLAYTVTQYRTEFKGDVTVMIPVGPVNQMNYYVSLAFYALWLATFYYSFMCLPLNFFSRYKIICRFNTGDAIITWKFWLKLTVMGLISTLIAASGLVDRLPQDEAVQWVFGTDQNLTQQEVYDMPALIAYMFFSPTANQTHHWRAYTITAVMSFCTLLVFLCYLIVFVSGYKIVKFTHSYSFQCAAAKNRKMAIFKVIALQAALPLMTSIPTVAIFFLSARILYTSKIQEYYFGMTSLIPLLDPLIPLYYIRPYRGVAIRLLKWIDAILSMGAFHIIPNNKFFYQRQANSV